MNQRVVEAAIKWWELNRPVKWSLKKHLRYPEVNCSGEAEKELGNAIAEYLEASIEFQKYMDNSAHIRKKEVR